ncbi:MAG: hypothetical protein KDJ97_36095 [Anaerolineae bacterium]|nr:hypothetical protein [Anaerolineae bacterium]
MTTQSELTERYKGTGIYGDAYYLTPGNTVFNRFSVGQHVKALGFEDSRGDWHEEIRGLVVESVKIVGLRWDYAVEFPSDHSRIPCEKNAYP